MSAIKLENIEKWFNNICVIQGLNLDINSGEFLVLVGPSGCGKTTTMRMIAGLEDASRGKILLDNEDVTHKVPSERKLSMVFQSYALYPHMTVGENMGFGLRNLGVDKKIIEQKVNDVAKILKLSDFLERRPKALSGGQRQRVAIGRAIVREPKAFLFDEPLSNLDAALRVEMRFEIARLHKDLKSTMIYVTHDQVEAMTLANRIVLMNKGNIVQIGTPKELYERPANLFCAEFIGSPRMNILPCSLANNQLSIPENKSSTYDGKVSNPDAVKKLGIRPEHITIVNSDDPKAHCLGQVEVVEYLGAETYVYIECQGVGNLIVRASEIENDNKGQNIGLVFDTSKIHFFDNQDNAIR